MRNRSTQVGGADFVHKQEIEDQDKLLYLAIKDKVIAEEVIRRAADFDPNYQPFLKSLAEGFATTRQNHNTWLETHMKSPHDTAAHMNVYNRVSIYRGYEGTGISISTEDAKGLFVRLDEIAKRQANGRIIAELQRTKALKANVIPLSKVQERAVKWLWQERIPLGKLTLLFGPGGLGKSLMTADMAARVSTGSPWPDGSPCESGKVLMISGEDDLADTIVPRLRAAGANLENIGAVKTVQVIKDGKLTERGFTLRDLPQLEASIKGGGYRLVVIDPLGAYLDGTDSHKDSDIRQILTPLKELAEKYAVTMLLVAHINKSKGVRAAQRVNGSVGISNACRAAYMIVEEGKSLERRLMLPTKLNVARQQGGLAYRVISSGTNDLEGKPLPIIEWLGDVQTTADEAISAAEDMTQGERDGAKEFLKSMLANGSRTATSIWNEAESMGISERTLKRAKYELCVECKKLGSGGWVWSLPKTEPVAESRAEDEANDHPF